MHFLAFLSTATLLGASAVHGSVLARRAELNGPCTGSGGNPGVCISTTSCSSGGGTSIVGACPGTPDNIRCCTKTSCGTGGNCRFTNQCTSGNTLTGLCPGPDNFKCCLPGTGGGGGGDNPTNPNYPAPDIPTVGACKRTAVEGAQKIVAAHKGFVREIGCKRDCGCPGDSDHCCGMATDMMNSDKAGVKTEAGSVMAEWIMRNRATLKLKYVIWGQRIWESGESEKPWSQWELMEDRGDNTANHWDHVHVSYQD